MTQNIDPRLVDDEADNRQVVEVGWVLVGRFDKSLSKAIRRARAAFAVVMRETFPEFAWRVPLIISGSQPATEGQGIHAVEPVGLLDIGLRERETNRWDFAMVVWSGELIGYEISTPIGAPSAAVGCAAIGAARLFQPCADPNDKQCQRQSIERTSTRCAHLAAHLLGHLVGLGHVDDPTGFMHAPRSLDDLERMQRFIPETVEKLRAELVDVADPRLEEEEASRDESPATHSEPWTRHRAKALRFALVAAWRNRSDVWGIVSRIRPWTIPLRLGRLAAAAVSTLAILLLTAETWEASMNQPAWRVMLIGGMSIIVASSYLIRRQRLLVHVGRGDSAYHGKRPARLSEQRSVGNVAVTIAVTLGMATTYLLIFVAAFVVAWTFYPARVVQNWASTVPSTIHLGHYFCLAGVVAALGLTIGALGAGFEPRGYVRHVAYVDEEI